MTARARSVSWALSEAEAALWNLQQVAEHHGMTAAVVAAGGMSRELAMLRAAVTVPARSVERGPVDCSTIGREL